MCTGSYINPRHLIPPVIISEVFHANADWVIIRIWVFILSLER